MKFIIKLAPEVTIKSKPVRKRFTQQLRQNIRNILQKIDTNVAVSGVWDNLFVQPSSQASQYQCDAIAESLACTPGIAHILQVESFQLQSLEDIFLKAKDLYREELKGKTFSVRVKRVGKHDFTSLDVERYVGGGLNQHTEAKGVKLNDPDIVIKIEIRDQDLFLVTRRINGLRGFPIGTQETTLTLLSGGFDSGVAAYQIMKRGIRTHFLFFNLGGSAHENGVKQVAEYIWRKFGSSHRVLFIAVPFEGVVAEILTKVDNSHMGVILKRMMYRAADQVAERFNLESFVTGEAIAQVSSQTMINLKVIEEVTDKLVFRPLVVSDKQEIIDQARRIGTAGFAETMPEYCGVISRKPTTRARLEKVLAEEQKFDFAVLDAALKNTVVRNIDELYVTNANDYKVPYRSNLSDDDILIDIRHPDEIDLKAPPKAINTLEIPFYRLRQAYPELDQSKSYVLYCDKGVMSKMQVLYLREQGFENVSVYGEG
ncbi:tRNA uracil 4-sulfurtransferase ThiI [Gynuella sunshinyii]|uniref:tRNA sulfurtransferase n=1 Tax=Gynuella sunshinyii YC6258 TaxID=1445510 RepID=A0A0C5VID4_9GAMM|nr:tRNA uracil 4-sulfurtransferase ThiI [Gynuella sunshinyii]AJQ94026.1 thiamine biosynthesis ATP pyrophosphatase [Gynuella sunshinyii YC6258]